MFQDAIFHYFLSSVSFRLKHIDKCFRKSDVRDVESFAEKRSYILGFSASMTSRNFAGSIFLASAAISDGIP